MIAEKDNNRVVGHAFVFELFELFGNPNIHFC